MSIADTDPLAVLPVTAAAASAAFARATDLARGVEDRRRQLEALQHALLAAERLLDRGKCVVAQLTVEIDERSSGGRSARCPGAMPVCPRCLGVPLVPSGEIAACLNCGVVRELPKGDFHCGEPANVTLVGTWQTPRSFCRSHAAAVRRDDSHLNVGVGSRPDRAALEEAARRSAVVGQGPFSRTGRGRGA